jgi:hypothetical protein
LLIDYLGQGAVHYSVSPQTLALRADLAGFLAAGTWLRRDWNGSVGI